MFIIVGELSEFEDQVSQEKKMKKKEIDPIALIIYRKLRLIC